MKIENRVWRNWSAAVALNECRHAGSSPAALNRSPTAAGNAAMALAKQRERQGAGLSLQPRIVYRTPVYKPAPVRADHAAVRVFKANFPELGAISLLPAKPLVPFQNSQGQSRFVGNFIGTLAGFNEVVSAKPALRGPVTAGHILGRAFFGNHIERRGKESA